MRFNLNRKLIEHNLWIDVFQALYIRPWMSGHDDVEPLQKR